MGVTSIAALAGDWRLERVIVDHLNENRSSFSGTAVFKPAETGWKYRETGELKTASGAFLASRSYQYVDEPGGAKVFFEGGAEFHSFQWASPITTHFCSPDLYTVAYRFMEWPVWHVGWHVRGPRKHYSLSSHYARP